MMNCEKPPTERYDADRRKVLLS